MTSAQQEVAGVSKPSTQAPPAASHKVWIIYD